MQTFDWATYRLLKRSLSKALYCFLSKRFHKKGSYGPVSISHLCVNKLGVSPATRPGRRYHLLAEAMEELVGVGFLSRNSLANPSLKPTQVHQVKFTHKRTYCAPRLKTKNRTSTVTKRPRLPLASEVIPQDDNAEGSEIRMMIANLPEREKEALLRKALDVAPSTLKESYRQSIEKGFFASTIKHRVIEAYLESLELSDVAIQAYLDSLYLVNAA